MDKLFKLSENKTNFRTEVIAGFTTFFTMAYIIFVNPAMLSDTGMDYNSVLVATCLSAAFGTVLIGLMSNYPFAQASGMGLNAFFVYTVCGAMAWRWEGGLAAVFISGIVFILITLSGLRGKILNSVPRSLKYAIGAGIGFFIASIGLKNGQLVSVGDGSILLGNFTNPNMLLTVIGFAITLILMILHVKGAILIGIVLSTLIGLTIPDGNGSTITSLAGVEVSTLSVIGFISFMLLIASIIIWGITNKKSVGILSGVFGILTIGLLIANVCSGESTLTLAPTFMKMDFNAMFVGENLFLQVVSMITVVLAFLIIDMFDTMGTIIGTAEKAGYLDKNGNLPRANKAMMADAIATAAGAVLGTSTVTTYVESVAGVNEGGRTGLTSVVVAILFIMALIFSPIAGIISSAATAPALIIVGILMMSPLIKIKWDDFTEAAPAFMTVLVMPFTTSITDGIAFGFITYAICKIFTKKSKEVGGIMWGIIVIFIIYYIMRAMIIK